MFLNTFYYLQNKTAVLKNQVKSNLCSHPTFQQYNKTMQQLEKNYFEVRNAGCLRSRNTF